MALSTAETARAHPRAASRPDARKLLFWAFSAAVLLRLFLTDTILNFWVNYTAEEGSIVEKIHPGSYALAATGLAALLSQRIALDARALRVVRALLALLATIAVLCAAMIAGGRAGSAGYLIDSYAVACLAGIALFAFPPEWRAAIGSLILVVVIASAALAIGEAALKVRLLPYPAQELSFRPTGLMSHPLSLGLTNAFGIGFVAAARWSPRAKAAAIAVLLLGAVAAGARLASLAAAASVLALILMARWPGIPTRQRLRLKALVLIGAVLALPVAVALFAALGLLDRFQNGLFDESAMARVDIYKVFDLVTWREILVGGDINAVRKIAFDRFNLEFIESALVIFVFQFGLVGTIPFLAVLAFVGHRLLAGAAWPVVLATLTFVAVALSNNTLSSKTASILMVLVLVEASRSAAEFGGPR